MNQFLIIKLSLIFLGSLIFSVLINRIFLKFSRNLGIRNLDENLIRWNSSSKPSFGGISFFIVFLLVLLLYQVLFPKAIASFDLNLIGVVAACSIGFLVGLTDDAFNTNPSLKFLAQAICAATLIITGNYIQLFDNQWLNFALTFLWVIGLMNSINMLDNMDGVTTIASIFALIGMLTVIYINKEYSNTYFILIIGLLGGLIGFLYFNWHPSRMYMGDTGSQFLGVVLAALSIQFLWNNEVALADKITSRQFILPLLAFLVPISDTTTVTINRLLKGQSPFVGGKDHTTHHLSYLGFSDQSVSLIVGGIGLVSTVLMLIALSIENWTHLFTILFSTYALVVFLSLYLITKERFSGNKKKHESQSEKDNKST